MMNFSFIHLIAFSNTTKNLTQLIHSYLTTIGSSNGSSSNLPVMLTQLMLLMEMLPLMAIVLLMTMITMITDRMATLRMVVVAMTTKALSLVLQMLRLLAGCAVMCAGVPSAAAPQSPLRAAGGGLTRSAPVIVLVWLAYHKPVRRCRCCATRGW